MKKTYFISLLVACCLNGIGQEITLTDVRKEIKSIFLSIGEVPKYWDHFTRPNIIIVRESDNKEVDNKNVIEQQEFAIYRVGTLAPHGYRHFIIVHNDKGLFVNMRQTLPQIVSNILANVDRYALNDQELSLILTTVMERYPENKKYGFGSFNDRDKPLPDSLQQIATENIRKETREFFDKVLQMKQDTVNRRLLFEYLKRKTNLWDE